MRARASDADDFDRHFLSETSWRTHFQELTANFGDPPPATVWEWLRRIRVETIGEEPLKGLVALEAEILLDGEPDGAVAALVDVLRENTNRFLTASEIWRELEPAATGAIAGPIRASQLPLQPPTRSTGLRARRP